ncbi:hypothetical protein QTP70_028087 [Hemibagrus guttatus]|uniref:Gypsy retrotransposon integrase-like protein 1 n=1 Tax=Hemibagrus guttatus TaxID=175788 RepID=A0AAE0VFH8_9TELE|nr:hypothetical protein QTP70_028087 [Hemibagrus guttatus]
MDPAAAAAGGQQSQNTSMDPAELRTIIVRQGALIRSFQDQVEALQSQLQGASAAAPPPLRDPPAPRGESSRMAMPEKYAGSTDRCRGSIHQCENFFVHQREVYRDEGTKCAFLLSLLMGRALDWASAVWDADPQIRASFMYFAALIDSGAAINLIDRALVKELRITTIPCMPSLRIMAIDSQPIGGGYLTHQTELLDFKHDPQISGHKGELVRWSAACISKCLHNPVSRPCFSSVVEDPTSLASGHIPRVYEDFQEVFSRERAARLPEHRAWDCAIDLLPNTSPSKGRVYPISLPEARAMEEYIEEARAVGHIRPSTSPAASGFFFVGKKDRGLRPCINYRGLNAIKDIPILAWWALLFTRFEFSVTYRPGTKNSKADALSRQFEAWSEPPQPDLILPAAAILAPVQWSFMEEIQRAHANEPPPANCPSTKLYVPLQFRQQVLQWVHEAPSSGHPGIHRSTQLAQRRFWWPSLRTDVERFVWSCSTCAQSRVSRQLPERLLEPLPTPQCPWSHLSVDFLTNLPNSGGIHHGDGRGGPIL